MHADKRRFFQRESAFISVQIPYPEFRLFSTRKARILRNEHKSIEKIHPFREFRVQRLHSSDFAAAIYFFQGAVFIVVGLIYNKSP